MAKGLYIGVNNLARKCKKAYIGVDNIARKIKKMYIGDENNIARLFYTAVEPGEQVFTASGIFTVPENVENIDIFVVGGGGGSGGSYEYTTTSSIINREGSAGAGGYTSTILNYKVNPGDELIVTVGAGGAGGKNYINEYGSNTGDVTSSSGITNGSKGGASSVTISSTVIISADGGSGGNKNTDTIYVNGVDGGSGSGVSGSYHTSTNKRYNRGTDGSDGSDGGYAYLSSDTSTACGTPGKGQGRTTRAFEESDGTLYSSAGKRTAPGDGGQAGDLIDSSYYNGKDGIVIIRWS